MLRWAQAGQTGRLRTALQVISNPSRASPAARPPAALCGACAAAGNAADDPLDEALRATRACMRMLAEPTGSSASQPSQHGSTTAGAMNSGSLGAVGSTPDVQEAAPVVSSAPAAFGVADDDDLT